MLGNQDNDEHSARKSEDDSCATPAEQAARCRRLASVTLDREAAGILSAMAADYERSASALRPDNDR